MEMLLGVAMPEGLRNKFIVTPKDALNTISRSQIVFRVTKFVILSRCYILKLKPKVAS